MRSARESRLIPRVQLDRNGKPFLAPDRVDLLRAIAEQGSITQAARRVGLSYKGAWDAVAALNQQAERPLVVRVAGGKRGGGTQLTPYGAQLLARVAALEAASVAMFTGASSARASAALPVRTSARNQWLATVRALHVRDVTTDVELALDTSVTCMARITTQSASALELAPGVRVCALLKATAVKVEPAARERARRPSNCLRGVVRTCSAAGGHAEVSVRLSRRCSVNAVAPQRAGSAPLAAGRAVDVVFSAQSVLLALPT